MFLRFVSVSQAGMSPDPLTLKAAEPSLAEPHHQKRLQPVYPEAEPLPLWVALTPLLQGQSGLTAQE